MDPSEDRQLVVAKSAPCCFFEFQMHFLALAKWAHADY